MFRCAGVFLVLALAFFAHEVSGEPLLDAYGIIEGVVTDTDEDPLHRVALSTVVNDSLITDMTDSQGRYTLVIPLFDEDSLKVDVHAYKSAYIPVDITNVWVKFGHITILNIELMCAAGPISGIITDEDFEEPIESVYVYVVGDPTKSTHSEPDGSYSLAVWDEGQYTICFEHRDLVPEYRDTVAVCFRRYEINVEMDRVIWYVSEDADDDTLRGSREYPFDRIQEAIDSSGTGDTVYVMVGTYGTELDGGISFRGKQIVVMSDTLELPESTIVDCGGQDRGFIFENDENPLSELRGLTIRNGRTAGSGGAILCSMGSPTIDGCVIDGNYASERGGGIAVQTLVSSPTFKYCIIKHNDTKERGGGVYCFEYCSPTFENCTVFGNSADSANGRGGGICSIMCNPTITKCIVWGNSDDSLSALTDQIDTSYSVPIVEYSDVQGEVIWGGIGNIKDHPLFCNPDECNLYLAENSPCYDYPPISPENIGALGMGCDSLSIIYGWVTDMATLDSIEEVSVEANCYNSSPVGTAITNSDGYYELLIISSCTDTADVTFSHPAYRDTTVDTTVFDPGYSRQLNVPMDSSGCDYIPGDCNYNGVPLELGDVTAMIGMYRGTVEAPYICNCPNVGLFAATADPNGNCLPFELADVTQEVCAYRGTRVAYGCCDCPGAGPPPPGACCIDLICEFTSEEQPCLDAGGTWYCGQTCPEFECPTVPAPSAGASAVPFLKSKARIDRNGLTQ